MVERLAVLVFAVLSGQRQLQGEVSFGSIHIPDMAQNRAVIILNVTIVKLPISGS
jgi:hypothetical protein